MLVFVLGALALIAFVAARFAQRIDELRAQTITLQAHAEHQLQSTNALAAALYLASTLPRGPGGFGPHAQPLLRTDGRTYEFPDGGRAELQDQRGLLSLNTVERETLLRVLVSRAVPVQEADSWFDVLQDYIDTDTLKRLNGAEAQEYAALGLPPPRNDWLISTRELARMPGWNTRAEVVDWFGQFSSTSRRAGINPNTAPLELLSVVMPDALPQQLELFNTVRKGSPFFDGTSARAATGLRLDGDGFVYFTGSELRISVSARGSARVVQYNVMLTPTGLQAPWLISEVYPVQRKRRSETPDRATPFPLAFATTHDPGSTALSADSRRASTER